MRPNGRFFVGVQFIYLFIMRIVSDSSINQSGDAGASTSTVVGIDPMNPVHLAYAGAAVVGGTVVVGSMAVTTIAAPGMVLIPAAIATGLCTYAHIENDRRAERMSSDVTDPAVA